MVYILGITSNSWWTLNQHKLIRNHGLLRPDCNSKGQKQKESCQTKLSQDSKQKKSRATKITPKVMKRFMIKKDKRRLHTSLSYFIYGFHNPLHHTSYDDLTKVEKIHGVERRAMGWTRSDRAWEQGISSFEYVGNKHQELDYRCGNRRETMLNL